MFKESRFLPIRVFFGVKRRILELPHLVSWYVSRKGKKNRIELETLKGKYTGKRVFIIANGPSLNSTDLSLLKNEFTISMNRFYLMFDKINFVPTFLVCFEELVLKQFSKDFNKLNCTKIFNWRQRKVLDNSLFIKESFNFNPFFQKDITSPTHGGGTVTFICLQLANYLGFSEIVLVGLDHSFHEKGVPGLEEVRNYKQDLSHFDPNYFPKGIKWKLPDLAKSEISYKLAKFELERQGKKVLDATVNGKCSIFQKVKYEELF
jgi:hypothetical protein